MDKFDRTVSLQRINDLFDQHAEEWLLVKFSISHNRLFAEKRFSDAMLDSRLSAYADAIHAMCQTVGMPDCVFLLSRLFAASIADFPVTRALCMRIMFVIACCRLPSRLEKLLLDI